MDTGTSSATCPGVVLIWSPSHLMRLVVSIIKRKWIRIVSAFLVNFDLAVELFACLQTSVRDNHLKLQPIVEMVIPYATHH